ncbi:MAG: dihydropteroate synthase [Rhodobacteraceae bacterium]|nr:dihydropteroate synthase [Paracoccaceae bacterium]
MDGYVRPIAQTDPARPDGARALAGGWCWFDRVELLHRGEPPSVLAASELPGDVLDRLSRPRAPLLGLDWTRPAIMGVLNATPDSFSDGGLYAAQADAIARARAIAEEGADILDIGGESTRPGADTVPPQDEAARVVPVISAVAAVGPRISIDTRKSAVAEAAVAAGATLINDVSGARHDPAILDVAARHELPICLMHSPEDPKTMQQDPRYDDVLLDIYDHLADRIRLAEAAGVPRHRVLVDPGIGFGKTLAHNLALLRRLTLFHTLGCPLLVGVSRKSFIGTLSGVSRAEDRVPGSIAAALAAVASGAQVLRVHDVAATRQAVSVMVPLMKTGGDLG